MTDTSIIATTVESIDLAAFLLALGFPLIDVNKIESVKANEMMKFSKGTASLSWQFGQVSEDGRWNLEEVRNGWQLPKEYTLEAPKLSRLLAHNLSLVKSLSQRPRDINYRDMGGIGMISDNDGNIIVRHQRSGWGGTCNSQLIALAITLGLTPMESYTSCGRLYMTFNAATNGELTLNDLGGLLESPSMRDENNTHVIAYLICQLDNRQVILDDIHNYGKKIRLSSQDGKTQVLYNPASVNKDKQREIIDFVL